MSVNGSGANQYQQQFITPESFLNAVNSGIISIPSLPGIAVKILDRVSTENLAMNDLAAIIAADPVVSVKILSIANASLYGQGQPIDSITRAINLLGLNIVKNITLSYLIICNSGIKKALGSCFDYAQFWRKSIMRSVASEIIAKRLGMWSEEVSIVALLSDIGKLIMCINMPDQYKTSEAASRATGKADHISEQEVFGFNHSVIGGEVLKQWKLPPSINIPVEYHHDKITCPAEVYNLVRVMDIADMAVSVYHSTGRNHAYKKISNVLMTEHHMSVEDIKELVDDIALKTDEFFGLYEFNADILPYSQTLLQTNEELVRLNLSYEQIVIELIDEKRKSEQLAHDLQDMVGKLKEYAFTDMTSSLFNKRFFCEMLKNEITRSMRNMKPVSLVLLDIDDFKKVNDVYGHLSGDRVIGEFGQLIKQCSRSSDVVARYGGEEFAITLAETGLDKAVIYAERLRRTIENHIFNLDSCEIKKTASLGIASFVPGTDTIDINDLIGAADKALYTAKQTGKNKLSCASSVTAKNGNG